MMNLDIYLNSCLSAFDCTLGWGTLGYLVLMAHPAIFNTHCVTEFATPRNTGIHPVMPDQDPMAAILSELIITHKHKVCLFHEYHAVDRACKKVISKLISENLQVPFESYHWLRKVHKSRSSDSPRHRVLWTLRIRCTRHRLEKKGSISGKTQFEEFIEQIEWNQEAVAVQNPYSPAHIVSMRYANIAKCGLYQDDCQKWSQKPRLEKTWSNFKDHFSRFFKEIQRSSRTSKTKVYVENIQAAQANEALFTKI